MASISAVGLPHAQPGRGQSAAVRVHPRDPDATAHRPLTIPIDLPDPQMARWRYQSPLRYPGAKSGLGKPIRELVLASSHLIGKPRLFVEPFAGGAATSLRLAGLGVVDHVLIADADRLVADFWITAAGDSDWLIDRMWAEPVTLERWEFWRQYRPQSVRENAMRCLFLNRTTFSGILHGRAGPIGGRAQSGDYSIDCRFNKTGLQQRLEYVAALYSTNRLVDVWCKDWCDTLEGIPESYPSLSPDDVIVYLDPPYFEKSPQLYGVSFDRLGGYAPRTSGVDIGGWKEGHEHMRLATYLRTKAQHRWILSYDNNDVLYDRRYYGAGRMSPDGHARRCSGVRQWPISKRLVSLRYSASSSGRGDAVPELLITTVPTSAATKVGLPTQPRIT